MLYSTLRIEQNASLRVSYQVVRLSPRPLVRLSSDITALTLAAYQPGSLPGVLPPYGVGDLILGRVSHLDAFSGYLCRAWLPSDAPGGTAGTPEARPSWSSRTEDSSPQVTCAHSG